MRFEIVDPCKGPIPVESKAIRALTIKITNLLLKEPNENVKISALVNTLGGQISRYSKTRHKTIIDLVAQNLHEIVPMIAAELRELCDKRGVEYD